jgi:hypothetical protein
MTEGQITPPVKRQTNFKKILNEAGVLLVEIILPVIISGGLLFWVSGMISFWEMDRSLATTLFAILFVLLSLILATLLSDFLNRLRNKKDPRVRLAVMVIAGLILPIGLFTGANLLSIAPGETYMTRLISLSQNQTVDVSMVQLGTTIINSTSPYTKISGIETINTIHSAAGLDQLFLVLNNDPTALSNGAISDALSKAFASYGVEAKPGLIAAFQAHVTSTKSANLPIDLYDRYFAQTIASLQTDINSQSVDSPTKLEELKEITALSTQLQTNLSGIETKSWNASDSDPMLDFVFNTFLQMDLSSDGDIYALARTSASNENYPDSVRGKALLLLAKFGDETDMPLLYGYLTNSSELIKANAFQAIADLTVRLNGTTTTK